LLTLYETVAAADRGFYATGIPFDLASENGARNTGLKQCHLSLVLIFVAAITRAITEGGNAIEPRLRLRQFAQLDHTEYLPTLVLHPLSIIASLSHSRIYESDNC
jgi:hypothetical protein